MSHFTSANLVTINIKCNKSTVAKQKIKGKELFWRIMFCSLKKWGTNITINSQPRESGNSCNGGQGLIEAESSGDIEWNIIRIVLLISSLHGCYNIVTFIRNSCLKSDQLELLRVWKCNLLVTAEAAASL